MARSQSNGALKYAGVALVAIAGSVAIGYLIGGAHMPHPMEQTIVPGTPSEITHPTPPISPSSIRPRTANGNYTAPGAPHIVIEEEREPILRRETPPEPAPKDPEATQEAPPTPAPAPTPKVAQTPTPSSDTSAPSPAPPDNSADGSTPPAEATPKPTPAPADPDFEQIGGTPPPTTDSEASQASGDTGPVQFRVQTGAYTDESNARSVADQLRSQGYTTSTRSERDGDHLVYKVQVGAYHSKVGANKAADDLQKKGYPAYVSPIEP